jgi:hypothetical protein
LDFLSAFLTSCYNAFASASTNDGMSAMIMEGERTVEPNPWFVMKVIRIDTRAKVFVNVCHHSEVPSNNNLRGTSKWPFIVSNCGRTIVETKSATDRDSSSAKDGSFAGGTVTVTVYDVLVSSQIVNLAAKDENVIDEVCRKAIRHLVKYYKEHIEDDYKLPKINKVSSLILLLVADSQSISDASLCYLEIQGRATIVSDARRRSKLSHHWNSFKKRLE